MTAPARLTFAQRLRVNAIGARRMTIDITADDARAIADALESQPVNVTVIRPEVVTDLPRGFMLRLSWIVTGYFTMAEAVRAFL